MVQLQFDEPPSERLCEILADIFPGALHVRLLGHGGAKDPTVWDLARLNHCLLVRKDEDSADSPSCAARRQSLCGFGAATVPHASSPISCDDVTTTSSASANRARPAFSNCDRSGASQERIANRDATRVVTLSLAKNPYTLWRLSLPVSADNVHESCAQAPPACRNVDRDFGQYGVTHRAWTEFLHPSRRRCFKRGESG